MREVGGWMEMGFLVHGDDSCLFYVGIRKVTLKGCMYVKGMMTWYSTALALFVSEVSMYWA